LTLDFAGIVCLSRSTSRRVEDDLIDQLFNSSEKRLARTLLLARDWHTTNTQLRLTMIAQWAVSGNNQNPSATFPDACIHRR
jgi:hypothetical protein